MTGRETTPEERELADVKRWAGAPRVILLGCSRISHDRLDFCSACCKGDPGLEVLGWRLLALMEQRARETP